jgi:hypothetical protein
LPPAASSAGRHGATWKHKPRAFKPNEGRRAGSRNRGKEKWDACRPRRAAGGRSFV